MKSEFEDKNENNKLIFLNYEQTEQSLGLAVESHENQAYNYIQALNNLDKLLQLLQRDQSDCNLYTN